MRLGRRARPRAGEADLIPLINVVFLMLVFFMLLGRVSSDAFPVTPPTSVTEGADAGTVTVLLAADGRLAVAGEIVPLERLASAVRERPPPPGPGEAVVLKADGGVRAAELARVVAQLRAAGVSEITLLTVAG